MKKIAAILTLFLAVTGISCSSDSDSNNNNNSDDIYVRFTANGQDYDFADPATASSLNMSINAQEGINDDLRRIVLWLPNNPTLGSHAIVDEPFNEEAYGANFYQGSDVSAAGTTGVMVITEITADYIEGTFGFTGEDNGTTYTITDGEFRAYNIE